MSCNKYSRIYILGKINIYMVNKGSGVLIWIDGWIVEIQIWLLEYYFSDFSKYQKVEICKLISLLEVKCVGSEYRRLVAEVQMYYFSGQFCY
jgi:hypothetical protein